MMPFIGQFGRPQTGPRKMWTGSLFPKKQKIGDNPHMLFLHLVSHSVFALFISVLWQGANQWAATVAPSLLVSSVVIALSVAAGVVLSHLIHEWGHFLGAVSSRSTYTLKKKISPLFFDFDYVKNNSRQYLWMSAGGPAGNVLLIALTTLLLPIDTVAQQWLLATMIGQLVYVLVLEGPVSLGILAGKNPVEVLATHFGQGTPLFQRSLLAGIGTALLSATVLTL
jgi:hypothetical protein